MCGIIGYAGKKDAKITDLLVRGLKRLEYRGYDSYGICVSAEGRLNLLKKKGKISEVEEDISDFSSSVKNHGGIGIAHTRWATHGEPNEINAHPHTDEDIDFAIVHNGIIENHDALRTLLMREGFSMKTETDSEVIVHLIKRFYSENLKDAVAKAVELLEGTFGIAVMSRKDDEIVVARKGSPLILGIGESEMFVASDVSAVLEHTRKVIYLDDGEVASVRPDGYDVMDIKGNNKDKAIHDIKWDLEEIEKKGYKHFMLKEIFEQPYSISNTLKGRLRDQKVKLDLDIDLENVKRIIITACGTSWHSALIGKLIIEKINKIPVEVDYASEFRYRNPMISSDDLVIAISQSGETTDTLEAIREAKRKGAKTFGIVNVVGSTIAREVDSGMYLHAGPEIGVASTKAFTTQVVDLLLFSLEMQEKKGLCMPSYCHDEIIKLAENIDKVLSQSENVRKVAEKIKDFNNILYLGRGFNFPVALEGALKLKEISYIHAEGYPAAEMKHGPIALIDKNMPVVFIAPRDHTYEKILSNMQEIKARGGKIIAITNDDSDPALRTLADEILVVPRTIDELSSVINVIPLQMLAYHVADLKGIDVDKPRNLAKSVTVE
ncbi:MAG: glutamine--fructose-6-phosphate transaminase (isomerizing) [Candidatus Woesearchaeota archaeon]